MPNLNRHAIMGHLGKDPEVRKFPDGGEICNFSVAVSEKWRDKATGSDKETTSWHDVVLRGKLAEVAGQYLRKGSAIYVEGPSRTRKWTDKEGRDRYTTEIHGLTMQMLGARTAPRETAPSPVDNTPSFDDDIPF